MKFTKQEIKSLKGLNFTQVTENRVEHLNGSHITKEGNNKYSTCYRLGYPNGKGNTIFNSQPNSDYEGMYFGASRTNRDFPHSITKHENPNAQP